MLVGSQCGYPHHSLLGNVLSVPGSLIGSVSCVQPSSWALPGCFKRMEICPISLPYDSLFFFFFFVSSCHNQPPEPWWGYLPGDAFLFCEMNWRLSNPLLSWSHQRCLREIPWNVWYVGGILFQFWTMTDFPHHDFPLAVSMGVWKRGRMRSSMWQFKCLSQNEKVLELFTFRQSPLPLLDLWAI